MIEKTTKEGKSFENSTIMGAVIRALKVPYALQEQSVEKKVRGVFPIND